MSHAKEITSDSLDDKLNGILDELVQIQVDLPSKDAESFSLFGLPELLFHRLTRDTENDHTGSRPYSGSLAMCMFIKRFGADIFGLGTAKVVELGAGIGVCGVYLARQHPSCQVTITDGQDLVLEIATKNASALPNTAVQKLVWSADPIDIDLPHHAFDLIMGSDLLYYQTDADVLVSTINTLLSVNGLALLPATIRSPNLPEDLRVAAAKYNLSLTSISLEAFLEPRELEAYFGWWNMTFLVLQRKGVTCSPSIQAVLKASHQRDYDPADEDDSTS
jgi:2-polyprenyl-3-methyl-5-hydroxy-6-metoxy-1,4-benzoquinol methylase